MKKSVLSLAVVAALGGATVSHAQAVDTAAFASAPKVATSVSGVEVFAGPVKGFDALTATDAQLAQSGLPPRPDAVANPKGYAKWKGAMAALRTRATDVRSTATYHGPMKAGNAQGSVSNSTPTATDSYNWSGVAAVNTRTGWSSSKSFDYIESFWNVPAAQPPGSACSNGITGPFYVSVWNGIDGFNSSDVIQGGTDSYVDCSGNISNVGWVEWYPGYSELDIYCGDNPCAVNPGDIFYTVTYGAAGKATQTVFDEDLTTGWYGTFSLSYVNGTGKGVIGNSAEWIVERPGVNGGLAALANTYYEFMDYSFAEDGEGDGYTSGTGGKGATLYDISMLADDGETIIESPEAGTSGFQGLYSILFSTDNCAESGGCTP